jgi:hypothetical protein
LTPDVRGALARLAATSICSLEAIGVALHGHPFYE